MPNATTVLAIHIVAMGLAGCGRPVARGPVSLRTRVSTRPSVPRVGGDASMIPSAYEVVELPTLGGGSSEAAAISDTGAVVGMAATADGSQHACLWVNARPEDLGLLRGTQQSYATSVNQSGLVVGHSDRTNLAFVPLPRAFLYRDRRMRSLGALPGQRYSWASGLNNRGQVVGFSMRAYVPPAPPRAFLYEDGRMRDLGLPARASSRANAINDRGDVVGLYSAEGEVRPGQAFLLSGGRLTDLPSLGGDACEAKAINNHGVAVGWSLLADRTQHACLWANGKVRDLGTLPGTTTSEALSINDDGVVVGTSSSSRQSVYRAFVWANGEMRDLNALIRPGQGWVLDAAGAVSSAGWIVGAGHHNGLGRGFLLKPR